MATYNWKIWVVMNDKLEFWYTSPNYGRGYWTKDPAKARVYRAECYVTAAVKRLRKHGHTKAWAKAARVELTY